MQRFIFILSLILGLLVIPRPGFSIQVNYQGRNSGQEGEFSVYEELSIPYVRLTDFCKKMACTVLQQWEKQKVLVENGPLHKMAIFSQLTSVVIIEGKVFYFQNPVLFKKTQGFYISVSLAQVLAQQLELGKVFVPVHKSMESAKAETPAAQSLRVIILDPGHGGNDFGTRQGALYEKDLALFYAQRLATAIREKFPDIEVLLTRSADQFVSLQERVRLANERGEGGAFLSLHLNHADDPKIQGPETFILSPEATDNDAKKTALLENETWVKNANGGALPSNDDIRKIFVDLEQQKFIQKSAVFAAYLQQELLQIQVDRKPKNRGVKQGFFYVLSQVAMPSVLMEMGFLSNSEDRGLLMDVGYQNKFVKAVLNAVLRYRKRPQQEN